MPWKASSVMEERLRFVARLLDGEAMTDVCRDFGVSRKTGYKIFDRYKEHGLVTLSDRSMGQRADVSHPRPSRSRMRSRMAIPDLPRPSLGYRPVTDAYSPHPAREDISPTHRHCRAPGSTGLDRQGAPDGGASTRGQGELIETANRHIQKNPRPTLDYSCGNCGRSAYSGPPRPRRLARNPGAVLQGELLSSSVRPASRVSKRAGPGSGLSLNFVDLVE